VVGVDRDKLDRGTVAPVEHPHHGGGETGVDLVRVRRSVEAVDVGDDLPDGVRPDDLGWREDGRRGQAA
jgi:hypothetical protein